VAPELLERVALLCDDELALLALECVCRGFRMATSRAWKRLTYKRFPRVRAIEQLTRQPGPGYRELFYRQLKAEYVVPPRPISLVGFVFTFELSVHGQRAQSWSAPYCRENAAYPTACLWSGEDAPIWFTLLLSVCRDSDTQPSSFAVVPENLRSSCACRIFVTHMWHTVLLYSGSPMAVGREGEDFIIFESRPAPRLFFGAGEVENVGAEVPEVVDLSQIWWFQPSLHHEGQPAQPTSDATKLGNMKLEVESSIDDSINTDALFWYISYLAATTQQQGTER